MRDWLREEGGIREMLGGECGFWIRQNLHTGVWGTSGAKALLEYTNGAPLCYTSSLAAHVSMLEWSGYWTFHGKEVDIR